MAGEIKVGMKFGSYNQMTEKMKRKYDTNSKTDNEKMQSEYIFYKRSTKKVQGNSYREALQFTENGYPKFVNAVIFYNNYQYGVISRDWEGLDQFDYIQGTSQYAVDMNGNGVIDVNDNINEIFDGKLDRNAYKQSKDSGSLMNYPEELKKSKQNNSEY